MSESKGFIYILTKDNYEQSEGVQLDLFYTRSWKKTLKNLEFFSNFKREINLDKQMPAKWNFLPYFIFLIPLKNISLKVTNKTQNTIVNWDTQISEELTKKIVILERVVWNLKF